MLKTKNEEYILRVLQYFPSSLLGEITRLSACRSGGLSEIREISVRANGRCSMLYGGENIQLFSHVTPEEAVMLARAISDGALYAQRDNIASGYISLHGGIRVGICGSAKYDGEKLVGISEIRSMLFRIPGHGCEFGDELISLYLEGIGSGLLIYSPPGVGKTTALRTLAGYVGCGRQSKRVAVVDERCEFNEEDYADCEVDILKGYKRRIGIEIATRTMSCELIIIDEIGADDAEDILSVVKCGIPLIATAHASSLEELLSKPALKPLLDIRAFESFIGISKTPEGYLLKKDSI